MAQSISPKMVDWILYNLPMLQNQIDSIEPKSSTSVVVIGQQSVRSPVSMVEKVAIQRATLSSVINSVKRGIRALHPEQRKIYRMKYRAGMTYKQIERRLYVSNKTVERRVEEIRAIIRQYLELVPPSDLEEFARFFS